MAKSALKFKDSVAAYEKLAQEIAARRFAPVYLLMGEESYFIDAIAERLATTVLGEAERAFNQITVYGKDSEAGQVINLCRQMPMMGSYQVVILKEAQQLKGLDKLSKQFGSLRIRSDNFNVMVSAAAPSSKEAAPQLSKENWRAVIQEQLHRYKEDGFDRINPSILKADLQATYPDFSERALGFKRFSDMLKALEKDGLLTVELDEQGTMLINVL